MIVEANVRNLPDALLAARQTEIARRLDILTRLGPANGVNDNNANRRRVRQNTRVTTVIRNWRSSSYLVSFTPIPFAALRGLT